MMDWWTDDDGIEYWEWNDGSIPINDDPSVIGWQNDDLSKSPSTYMNDDDFSTNDDTQSGGFWDDIIGSIGSAFGGAVQNVANAATKAAQDAAILAIKKKAPAPAPTATPGATVFGMDQKSAITLGVVLLAGLLALRAS